MAGASIQSRAYSNSSDEFGIRPDTPVEAVRRVACWPTRSARLLRASRKNLLFAQISHNAPISNASGRRSTLMCENARKQTDPCADFVCLELSRGRTLGWNQYVGLEIKKAKVNGTGSKLPAAQKPYADGKGGVTTDCVGGTAEVKLSKADGRVTKNHPLQVEAH